MEPLGEGWTGQFCSALDTSRRQKVSELLADLVFTADDVERLMTVFGQQMDLANSADQAARQSSDLLMENTHVRHLMDGTENGAYLGLDLGGTNFRVVLVELTNGVADTVIETYTIPETVLCGPSQGIFDFIATSILDFECKNGLTDRKEPLPLGFTFSFPSKQLALNSCLLLTWTKSFKCTDGVGMDPVKLLQEALGKHGLGRKIDVVAVTSDTTSTLLAANYADKKSRLGVILGTGSNAAFVENLSNIARWTGDMKTPTHVIVNVEWGAAGDGGCLDFYRTDLDRQVDKESNHPGSFTFEKSFSGLYLGELVRLVLVKLAKHGLLFSGQLPSFLSRPWTLNTTHVTEIECDVGPETSRTWQVLRQLKVTEESSVNDDDVALVREVAEMVSRRGAYIVASAIAALVNRTCLPEVSVGIDGSLYECHPKYHKHLMDILNNFCPRCQVKLLLVKDGSGLGAAFAAVSALRQRTEGLRCS